LYSRIDHVGVVVPDISEALQWYVDSLGWELRHQEYISDVGAHVAYLLPGTQGMEDGATSLQLVQPVEPSAVLDHLRTKGEGLHHICFETANISQALIELGDDPERVFTGGRNRLACFLQESPNGVLIELTGPVLDAAATPRR